MSSPVAGKTVLITGPARGIGEATARKLAQRGAKLSLVGLEPERLQALANELGPGHVWFECDVTRQPTLEAAVEGTVRALGGIDVVMANAGIASHGTVAVTPVEAMARVIEVNLTGVIRTVSATLPHVTARRGYYLLISSAAALATSPGLAAYSAAKSGVEHFANALRVELAAKGVQVGSAHPCWIPTDLVRDVQQDMAAFNEMLRALPGPFGTITPVDVCAAALADAIERRERKVFVPRSLGPFAALRQLLMSSLSEHFMRQKTDSIIRRMEREAAALRQPFGEHSVEFRRETSDGVQ